jgi:cephalosporin hydroxylase
MEVVKTIRCRPVADPVIDQFHRRYYDAEADTWKNTKWMGVGTQKCPLDLWIYQEILREIRPGLIIETGTFSGGSALYLAHICDLLGTGRIVSIDLDPQSDLPSHERITYLRGSSIDPQIVDAVPKDPKPVMVILDSDHSAPHVLSELRLYSPFVSIGSYLIVEDTNINGHPALDDFGPGPMEALEEFLAENDNFVVDTAREKFMLTFNPSGYLRRIDPLVDKADRAVPVQSPSCAHEEERIPQLEQEVSGLRAELATLRNTKTFRWSSTFRDAYRRINQVLGRTVK